MWKVWVVTRWKVKVKQSRYRPAVAQKVPGSLGSQIFVTFGTWRWRGRQPHAPAAFTPRNVPGTHFHWGLSRPQGRIGRNMSLKNQVTPSGIDPGTVRLIAQRLNHYATPGPDPLESSIPKCGGGTEENNDDKLDYTRNSNSWKVKRFKFHMVLYDKILVFKTLDVP